MPKCKSKPPKADHFLFISLLNKKSSWLFHGQKLGPPDSLQVSHRTLESCVWCTNDSHVSPFESRASISNSHLQTTGRGQVGTGRVQCTPDQYVESIAKSKDTGRGQCTLTRHTGPIRREGFFVRDHRTCSCVRCHERFCSESPDAQHRLAHVTVRVSGEYTTTSTTHRTHRARPVQLSMLQGQRFTAATSPNFSPAQ